MVLDLENGVEGVILFEEGTEVFHIKSLTKEVCYKATPRGKLRKKGKLNKFKKGDLVIIKPIEGRKSYQIIKKMGPVAADSKFYNYTSEDHNCSFESF